MLVGVLYPLSEEPVTNWFLCSLWGTLIVREGIVESRRLKVDFPLAIQGVHRFPGEMVFENRSLGALHTFR